MPLLDDAKKLYVNFKPIQTVMAGTQKVWPKVQGLPSAPGYIANYFAGNNLLEVGFTNAKADSPDFPILGYKISYQKASANQFDESKWFEPQKEDYYWQDPPPAGGQMAIFPSGKNGWFCPLDPETNDPLPEFCFSQACYWRFRVRAYTAAGFGPYVISDPYEQSNKRCSTPDIRTEGQWSLFSTLRPSNDTGNSCTSFMALPQSDGSKIEPTWENNPLVLQDYWPSAFSTNRTSQPSRPEVGSWVATFDDTYDDEWTVDFYFNGTSNVQKPVDLLDLQGVGVISLDASQGLEQNFLTFRSTRDFQRSYNFKFNQYGAQGHYVALTKRSNENFVRWYWNGFQQPQIDTLSEKIGVLFIKNYQNNNGNNLCLNDIEVKNRCIYYGDFEYPTID